MIDYVKGRLDSVTPTHAVVECAGVGYHVHISLHTYTAIKDAAEIKLLTHLAIREDAHTLFGFHTEAERVLFRHLISVSGVGAATARMILSSLNPMEVEKAILSGDVMTMKRIKGIGAKTAERIIIDLRDKVGKGEITDMAGMLAGPVVSEEAILALMALGFNRVAVEKTVRKVLTEQGSGLKVEEIIKWALKYL